MSFLISQNKANFEAFFFRSFHQTQISHFWKGQLLYGLILKYIFFGFSHILIQNKPMWRRWSTAAAPIFHSTTKYIVTLFTAVAFCSYDCYGMRSLFFCLEKQCSLLLKSTFWLILLQKTCMLGFLLYRDLFSLPKCWKIADVSFNVTD